MIIAALAIFGLIFGSFVSALTWRIHEQAELEGATGKTAAKRRRELSMTKGRSMCPHCSHELAPKDLVPVVSWLWLRGRCRYCRKPIPDSPLTELVTGTLFVVSYLAWPASFSGVHLFQFITWLAFVVAFVALAVYDLRWYELPFRIVDKLIGLAVLEVVIVAIWRQDWRLLWQPVVAAIIIYGLFKGIAVVSGGKWIGGGDVRLAIALGLIAATPLGALLVIFFSSLLGTVAGLPALVNGKQGLKARIPYGPFLLAALIIVQLWGSGVIHWYERLLIG